MRLVLWLFLWVDVGCSVVLVYQRDWLFLCPIFGAAVILKGLVSGGRLV
jgi:hypothetical protein